MKVFAAILAIALCSSGILVQGGLIGDVVGGVGDGLNTVLYTVQAIIENLVGIITGLPLPLPNIKISANTDLKDISLDIGDVQVQALEDNNLLDLKVDNVSLLITNANLSATLSVTNLNLPALGNVSLNEDITITLTEISITATVELTLGLKPLVSDLIDIRVEIQAAVVANTNVNSDLANLALGANLPLSLSVALGDAAQQNKQSIISYINNNLL